MSAARNKIAIFYDRKKNAFRVIRYSRVDTAIPRLTYHAMFLEPGTVIQITHADTSMWIGDIIVKVNRELSTHFTWDEDGAKDIKYKPFKGKPYVK